MQIVVRQSWRVLGDMGCVLCRGGQACLHRAAGEGLSHGEQAGCTPQEVCGRCAAKTDA